MNCNFLYYLRPPKEWLPLLLPPPLERLPPNEPPERVPPIEPPECAPPNEPPERAPPNEPPERAPLIEPAERVLPIELLLIELELPPLFPPNVFVLVRLGVTVPML